MIPSRLKAVSGATGSHHEHKIILSAQGSRDFRIEDFLPTHMMIFIFVQDTLNYNVLNFVYIVHILHKIFIPGGFNHSFAELTKISIFEVPIG